MAAIQEHIHEGNERGKRRAKKQSLHIDMTPMVDLAFLLLSFFVLTAVFTKLKSMQLTLPGTDGEPTVLKNGITFLLGDNDRIFYYEGEFRTHDVDGRPKTQLTELSFSKKEKQSLHNYLLYKNKNMHAQLRAIVSKNTGVTAIDTDLKKQMLEVRAGKEAYTYLIKSDNNATYGSVVAVLNELNINLVGKYVIEDMAEAERNLLKEKTGGVN